MNNNLNTQNGSGDITVAWRKACSPTHPKARYPGYNPRTELLKCGTQRVKGARSLTCDIVWDIDVPVTLRDGTIIYIDIFRPAARLNESGVLPAIVAWSPYGKQEGMSILDDFPFRAGVSKSAVSNYQKWEGPDPAYWCAKGYAVIHPDSRGAYKSQGDIVSWGEQEALDAHDVIEWLGEQYWCNGKVGLAGNSWLAISQWFIAATRPRHLAAIAPWEGFTDVYRHHIAIGGIPDDGFSEQVFNWLAGEGNVEDVPAMIARYPLINSYWKSKAANVANINVPTYVVASWGNPVHTPGTFDGWAQLTCEEKWLRVHDTMEWPDFYENEADLQRFFDRYLKGEQNNWERTPRVRLSLLGAPDEKSRLECDQYPPANVQFKKLYLDAASGSLTESLRQNATLEYVADDNKGCATFSFEMPKTCNLVGPLKLCLYVSTDIAEDIDLFVKLRPLTDSGKVRWQRTIPLKGIVARVATTLLRLSKKRELGLLFYDGPHGRLRVSRREISTQGGADYLVHHPHERPLPVRKGEVFEVKLNLTPLGMYFKAGDKLQLKIAGYNMSSWPMTGAAVTKSINKGKTMIHTGQQYPAHLLMPELSS